ncbi:HlyD family type I secretion periplasmic adaptor subunit [Shinella zoogloeoides]|uniref:HlyD family type I secretion periplasmic adaptor subunit n=1 Tax=Shinella zoogloeoides TaxID=352475 RepID=UPI000E65B33B|nr:HlyD family type I secretion periplasmic adaptor subunit [Shinella zoogloeoides]WPE22766.1 Type I secretion system membrane fusion protein PrsE [Shinella zoogloeoides]
MSKETSNPFRIGPRILAGTTLGFLLVAGAGGWAATMQLSGAVIAQGQIAVDQQIKAIQHRDGGIVSEIAVREGDLVKEGQVLLRLDDAQTRAELSIVRAQLLELTVRRTRLLAERDLLAEIEFPGGLDLGHAERRLLVSGERRLFEGNRLNRESRKQQLELGTVQVAKEIVGLEAQRSSKSDEIALVEEQRAKLEKLARQQLIERAPLYSANRDFARLQGEQGEIDAAIARARSKVNEIRLQIIAIDETARTEAQRELTAVETKLSELQDRQMAISDRLSRTEIRAPLSGTVNELNIHTIGGVITPAEVLVTIVPTNARLKVEVMLQPTAIDQVEPGSSARLRLTALNQRTTPELFGLVSHVSPATTRDAASGQLYYKGDVEIKEGELAKIGQSRLIPGMPVEVYVTTSERTALSYLVKPIVDQFSKAFRER